MEGSLYFPVFIAITSVFCIAMSMQYMSSGSTSMFDKGNVSMILPLAICIIFAYWVGNRPVFSASFGDTYSYARNYLSDDSHYLNIDFSDEWMLSLLMYLCHLVGLQVSAFFVVVALGYSLCMLYAIKIFMPNNVLLGLLFCLGSFSFFSFSSNGIRNGLACHMCMLSMALYLYDKYPAAVLLAAMAFSTHKSVVLPLASFFAAIYAIKNPKSAVILWCLSIAVSFVAGGFFTALFTSLGFDDRMDQYTSDSLVNRVGGSFRWDFLLYSAMPILMYWYVCVARNIGDNWYRVLGATYCLANSFWVLVIRAAFSNRFAYLSWFLYPVIIAYPLVNTFIWDDQDQKTGTILFLYIFLTLTICFFTGMI